MYEQIFIIKIRYNNIIYTLKQATIKDYYCFVNKRTRLPDDLDFTHIGNRRTNHV